MERIKLLSAFQVLSMPEGSYSPATHERAREVIEQLTGRRPVGYPPTGKALALDDYLAWLDEAECL